MAGSTAAITAAGLIVLGRIGARLRVRGTWNLVRKGKERIALGAAKVATRLLAEEENHEAED